jgi:hypothetical protein
MKEKVKISYKLGDYAGIDLNKIPKQLKPYVRLHISVYQKVLDEIKEETEKTLIGRIERVEEDHELWKNLQVFIIGHQKQLDTWHEIEERTFRKENVFRGDISQCVLDNKGQLFWIDYDALEDSRIEYWQESLKSSESLLEHAKQLPQSDTKDKAVLKCMQQISMAQEKLAKSSKSIKRIEVRKEIESQEAKLDALQKKLQELKNKNKGA